MAATAKKTTKKNTTVKRNTASKRKPDKRTVEKKKQFYAGEIVSVLIIFLSIFLFLSNFDLLGKIGGFFGSIQKGLFGVIGYVFPIFLLTIVFYVRKTKGQAFAAAKDVCFGLLMIPLSALAHLIAGTKETLGFAELYRLGGEGVFTDGAAGGAIGGSWCNLISGGMGRAGAWLITILLAVICLVILTERSIVEMLRRGAGTTADVARKGAVKTAAYAKAGSERLKDRIAKGHAAVDPASSRFDMNTHGESMQTYGTDLLSDLPAGGEIRITGEEEPVSEMAETAPKAEIDYEIDSVPFEETREDRYRTYDRILAGGQIDIRDAGKLGFAVSGEADTIFGDPDDGEAKYLHRPLDPDEIVYPVREFVHPSAEAVHPEIQPEEAREEIPAEMPEETREVNIEDNREEEPEGEEISYEETPLPETVKAQTAPAVPEEKPKKTAEQAQAELDKKRAEEKKAAPEKVRPYQFPPLSLLAKGMRSEPVNMSENRSNSIKLEQVLREFGVGVTVTNVVRGPRVTRYEMTPDVGVKVSRITSLADDIKLALAATDLRIEAPIPGKSAVGIEVPNAHSSMVTFRDILDTPELKNAKSKLSWGVGLDIQGTPVVGNIAKMPHLLISGTTGSGKSVAVNTIIMSVLYRARPEEVKMILIDPKVVELSPYDGIPHLLTPVVTKPSEAINVLNKACEEMNRRYRLFKESNTRNIDGYNEKARQVSEMLPPGQEKPEVLPYILIVIDELAELMQHSKKDVEGAIASLTQLARAAGIHLVVVTQRPSVDVVTGLIKSNIPSRVALKLPTLIDSRTILDSGGAETLLGNGDMLYKPGDVSSPYRLQGAYMSDEEVENIIEWIKKHNTTAYNEEWEESLTAVTASEAGALSGDQPAGDGRDELFVPAGDLITEKKKASIGMLQRRFKIGFNRAARIMDELFDAGVVSDSEGTKERQILMTNEEFRDRFGYEES